MKTMTTTTEAPLFSAPVIEAGIKKLRSMVSGLDHEDADSLAYDTAKIAELRASLEADLTAGENATIKADFEGALHSEETSKYLGAIARYRDVVGQVCAGIGG
jgi:hypothetical protein